MLPISVVICCANVEATLPAACESVAWANELVIVDSGSSDDTAAIAQRFADRYVVEPWRGYTGQKKYGTQLCRNDWVLVLDGDEEVSPSLATEIGQLTQDEMDGLDVLEMPRQTFLMGKAPRAWWPDWQDRLIHRERCIWADEVLHDRRRPSHPSRARRLRGELWHQRHSKGGFHDFFAGAQEEHRALIMAMQMFDRGRRCQWWDVAIRPSAAVFKSLVLKRGLLDGSLGLLVAQRAATLTLLKYAALWSIENDALSAKEKEMLARVFAKPVVPDATVSPPQAGGTPSP